MRGVVLYRWEDMEKKQLVVALLEKLKPYRDMAWALSELVQSLEDEDAIQELSNGILKMLTQADISAKNKLSATKKEKAATYLRKIRDTEKTEKWWVDAELDDLLAQI